MMQLNKETNQVSGIYKYVPRKKKNGGKISYLISKGL